MIRFQLKVFSFSASTTEPRDKNDSNFENITTFRTEDEPHYGIQDEYNIEGGTDYHVFSVRIET